VSEQSITRDVGCAYVIRTCSPASIRHGQSATKIWWTSPCRTTYDLPLVHDILLVAQCLQYTHASLRAIPTWIRHGGTHMCPVPVQDITEDIAATMAHVQGGKAIEVQPFSSLWLL